MVAAVTGLAALQLLAFIHAYQQRLGGHLDEARRGLETLINGTGRMAAEEASLRDRFAAVARDRVDGLTAAQDAIDNAGSFEKPFIFFTHLDVEIALATAKSFIPAIPLDGPSLIFGGIGIVLGWIMWGMIKAPAALFRRKGKRTRV
ncbi:MAG: DUF2937 family protein [Rhodospirillaceae bacterium]|nr:DUF2937 family protein [Rhodospirillaceae bacterium]